MGNFKGTQGKWTSSNKGDYFGIDSNQHTNLAIVKTGMIPSKEDIKEARSNAKLIAAAPELLEVLIKIKEMDLEEIYPGFNNETSITEIINKVTS